MKKKVLFLCTANACRSQMAEGLLRSLKPDSYEVFSAGTRVSTVNPNAAEAMKLIGIDISSHYSKSIDQLIDQLPEKKFDIIVTVCDNAKQQCPIIDSKATLLHWSIPDPADAKGTQQEILRVFTEIRDTIAQKIKLQFCSD